MRAGALATMTMLIARRDARRPSFDHSLEKHQFWMVEQILASVALHCRFREQELGAEVATSRLIVEPIRFTTFINLGLF
jgi:hypothetical protein